MGALPPEIVRVLRVFEDVFSERVWDRARVLVVGAILTPGRRTVAAVLRVVGLGEERQFQNYHRVLNRARWSSRELSRRPLVVLVQAFVPADAPVLVGFDETLERRRGGRSRRKGSPATRCGRASATSSRRAACAGSRCRCWPRSPGPGGPGACRS